MIVNSWKGEVVHRSGDGTMIRTEAYLGINLVGGLGFVVNGFIRQCVRSM